MALLHQAELRPSKTELIEAWAPSQPWFSGEAGVVLSAVGAFRFDDPEGEVGVETILVRSGDGPVMQVPLSYRGAPLAGAEAWLVGTMEHSVLGKRWVYDGAGDPVYLLTVASAALHGASQAELMIEVDGEMVKREPTATVTGGTVPNAPAATLPAVEEISMRQEAETTIVETGALRFALARVIGDRPLATTDSTTGILSGIWDGHAEPQPLVAVGALAR